MSGRFCGGRDLVDLVYVVPLAALVFLGLVLRMSERLRLETLIARDGLEQSKLWANKTVGLYHSSFCEPSHYASQSDWKPLFEESIQELKHFSGTGEVP